MFFKDKKLKFSIRKLSIGVLSAAIGAVGLGATITVQAQEELKKVHVKYVDKNELSKAQLQRVTKEKGTIGAYDTYYLVYKYKGDSGKLLPKAGAYIYDQALMMTGAVLLIGVSFVRGRKRKLITSIVLVTALGAIPLNVLAVEDLGRYNQTLELMVGQELPDVIKNIEGYEFIGYLPTNEGKFIQISEKEDIDRLNHKENLSNQIEKNNIKVDVKDNTEVKIKEIPFEKQYQYSDALEKGREKLIQDGVNGKIKQIYIGDELQKEEVVLKPVYQIILVGTKENHANKENQDSIVKTKDIDVPYGRDVVYDDQLDVGIKKVVQVGKVGKKKQYLKDGEIISEEVVEKPVNEVVHLGTKFILEREIPFEIEYIEDATLDSGEEIVVQEGENGQEKQIYVRDKLISTEVLKEPKKRIVKVGTKHTNVIDELIDFNTEYVEDESMNVGEEKVVQAGQAGLKRVTYINGERTSEEVTTPAITEIIHVGVRSEYINPIFYDIEYIEDAALDSGEEIVVQEGENGQEKQIYVRDKLISKEVLKEAKKRIVKVGTKHTNVIDESIDFNTEYVEDESMFSGEEKVVKEGQTGLKRVTYINGERTSEEVLTPAITEIIHVGVRNEYINPIFYDIEYIEDNTLDSGEEIVVQEGEEGQEKQIYVRDKLISKEVLKEAKKRIVKVGTKHTNVIDESIDFNTEYVEDESMFSGEEKVVKEGQTGLKRVTYINGERTSEEVLTPAITEIIHVGVRNEYINSIFYDIEYIEDAALDLGEEIVVQEGEEGQEKQIYVRDKLISKEVLKEAKKRIVKVGTKHTNVIDESIDFNTEYVEDESMNVGEEKVVQAGQTGLKRVTYINGERTSEEVLTPAIIEIIHVGVRNEYINSIFYETEYIEDATLDSGEEIVVQEGEEGQEKQIYVRDKLISKEVLKEAKKRIVKVGTKHTNVIDESIDFNTEYVEDESMFTGEEKVVQEGQTGLRRVTYINGERTSEEVITSVKNEIIHIGIKREEIVEIPFNIVYKDDDKILEGMERKVQEGVNGKRKDTYIKDKLVSSEVIQNSVDEVIALGRKKAVDKTELEKLILHSDSLQEIKYTESSWHKLDLELTKAKTILTNGDVTQEIIDEQVESLQSKIDELVVKKRKPILAYNEILKNELEKTVRIHYTLDDVDYVYRSAKLAVLQNNQMISEYDLGDLLEKSVTLPNYEVPYILRTTYRYEDSYGTVQEEVLDDKEVKLELKKIEIKDIDRIQLFKKVENGNDQEVKRLMSLPENPQDYYLRIRSDRLKDMLLPLSAITDESDTNYRLHVQMPELVQDKDLGPSSVYMDGFSLLFPKYTAGEKVYLDFSELIQDIQNNPSGNFVIGADLEVKNYTKSPKQFAYIDREFRGTLSSESGDKAYTIYGLSAPLFKDIKNATIKDLYLKDVSISNREVGLGVLAKNVNQSTIQNVSIAGNVTAQRNIGSIAYLVADSLLENVSFEGTLTTLTNTDENNVGGLVGALARATIKDAYVSANIDATTSTAKARVGGIVGFTNGTSAQVDGGYNVFNVVTEGSIQASKNNQVGGIVGSTEGTTPGKVKLAINGMKVKNGQAVYGYLNVQDDHMVDLYSKTQIQDRVNNINQEEFNQKLATNPGYIFNDKGNVTIFETNYMELPQAKREYNVAYLNVEKLMPFYNKELIVKYGNSVSLDEKIANTVLLSVVPMKDKQVVSDISSQKETINRLMLHYEDGTVDFVDIQYLGEFKSTGIIEYQLQGKDLLYTPNHLISNYQNIIDAVKDEYQEVDYHSDSVLSALNKTAKNEEARDALLDQLYLEDTFNEVKLDIEQQLRQILATDKSINTSVGAVSDELIDYLKENKEKLLVGLSYMKRWYNINFGEMNVQSLATFYQDFYGKPVNTMEWLISIAEAGYDQVVVANNLLTYIQKIAPNTNKQSLFDYLTDNRKLFTNYSDDNDWFKDTTKAYIVESKSKERPDVSVKVYDRLKNATTEQNGVLPLLSAQEGLFIITNMTTITYGMFDRYMDMNLQKTDPASYDSEVQRVKVAIDRQGENQARLMDTWYRLVPENVKNTIIRTVPVWDGYSVRNKWLPKYGVDANQAIKDFFGPVGKRSDVKSNGSGAYANGSSIFFVVDGVLGDYGHSVFTHELAHNSDSGTYLAGFGRRSGMGAESYAMGLFEVPSGYDSSIFSWNLTFDHSDKVDYPNRLVNVNPDSFVTSADLQSYTHGMMDVVYLLDYSEANAVLKQSNEDKKKWYGVFENVYDNSKNIDAVDRIRTLTDEEVNGLTTWEDLVKKNITSMKGFNYNEKYNRNNYYVLSLFTSNYSALNNPNGAPGGITFRRMAFEMMADKGYEEGFIPYASNQLNSKTKRITDQIVFEHIYNNQYNDWTEFKIAKFKERLDKLDSLQTISFDFFGNHYENVNFEQINQMMEDAVVWDLKNNRASTSGRASMVHLLKISIYNAYLRQTNDFRNSIFE